MIDGYIGGVSHLTYKYRLYPSKAQILSLDEMLGAFCDLYNAGLQQRIEAYRRAGKTLRYLDQARELKAVRAADDRLARYGFTAAQQVLRRLHKAFDGFFRRVKEGKRPGFPRFKPVARFNSLDLQVRNGLLIDDDGRLGIVGVPGTIKVKWHRGLPRDAKLGAAVLRRHCGKWFICFHVETAQAAPLRDGDKVGVDLGITSFLALSNGETIRGPAFGARAAKALRRAQRSASRKVRGSRRHKAAAAAVGKLHHQIVRRRVDFSHKLSREIVNRFAVVAFEDLNIGGLAGAALSNQVRDAAWATFIQQVTYKASNAGGAVVLVDPRGTSQTCPECGTIKPKRLDQRRHRCECGADYDRDVAAAMVVHYRAFGFWPGAGRWALSGPVAA